MQQQLAKRSDSLESINNSIEERAALIYLEDFSLDLQRKFIIAQLYPYFKNVFADLVLRSAPNPKQNSKPSIDKVSLTEFT